MHDGEPLENMFSLRDVTRHSNLRRNIGGLYTRAAAKDLEPKMQSCISVFLAEIARRIGSGQRELDMSVWLHFFAYDSLGEINVSKKLDFMEKGVDINGLIEASSKLLKMVGYVSLACVNDSAIETDNGQFTQAPILHRVLGYMRSLVPAEEAEPMMKVTET